jgi:putative hydroxymethylpyrimidine transporter CytX
MNAKTETKLGSWSLAALWFGAAVSLAEIWSGGLLSPLGPVWGQVANLSGHLLGGLIFLGAAWISARERKNAMAVLARPFGAPGPKVFAVLNITQLVGWTAVMLITGALALDTVAKSFGYADFLVPGKLILGVLLLGWVIAGWKGVKTLNVVAVVLLLGLTIVISWLLLVKPDLAVPPKADPMTFPLGMELVLSLPVSWLPLIGDYTSRAKGQRSGTWASTLGYAAGSVWMFSTGLLGTLKTGQSDPTQLMVAAGLGIAGVVVILLSTVTTAFLDVYSAGISATALGKRIKDKPAALVFTVLGTLLALIFPMDQYVNFLYVLGAVFCPLYAVVLTDYFFFKQPTDRKTVRVWAFVAWAAGTGLYYVFMNLNSPIGMTIPTALLSALIYFVARKRLEK